MREIKLRDTYKHRGTGKLGTVVSTLTEIEENDSWQGETPWELIGRDEYTGLKDKNGREIYEGDIWAPGKDAEGFEVFWLTWDSGFRLRGSAEFDPSTWHYGEVIGNIWENPDLLPDPPNRVQPDGGAEG